MKHVLVIIIVVLFSIHLKAQSYVPFIVDSTHWFVIDQPGFGPPPWLHIEYYMLGDTTISTVTYAKVYERSDYREFLGSGLTGSFTLSALVREDTLTRKVYWIPFNNWFTMCTNNQETLLYDFDVVLGDTLLMSNHCNLGQNMVIASINPSNGWLTSPTYNSIIYMGVGSQTGVFQFLLGFQYTNPIDYCRGGLNNCFVVGIDEIQSLSVGINPNPTIGQLSITLNELKTGSLRVLNSLGQVVFEDDFDAVTELNFSLDGPSGMYFLQLEIDGQLITKKIIKE